LAIALAALLFEGAATSPSFAGFQTYVTPSGSTTSGPVSAEADFTTGTNSVTVVLKNLQPNITDVAQALSDLSFTLSTTPTSTPTLLTSSGVERTVAGDGSFTDGSTVAAGWPLSNVGATLTLDVLAAGGAGPSHLIIGPPDGSNLYSNANGSIAGNKPHNPVLADSATFTINAPGVTSSTTVNSAVFSFGTTSGITVSGVPQAVPEPASLVMASTAALIGLGYVWNRRRRASATA
jgi:hypothetical protein